MSKFFEKYCRQLNMAIAILVNDVTNTGENYVKRPCHPMPFAFQHMVKSLGKDLSFPSKLESLEDSRKLIFTCQFY